MTNTTKAWLLCHPIPGYIFIAGLASLCAYFFNNQHWANILIDKENSYFIFYFWIIISPLFLAPNRESVGGIAFMAIGIICIKALIMVCYFKDCTINYLPYVALFVDSVATIYSIVLGIRIGKWTYANIDEVIPRRAKWRNSKVDIYSFSLNYSINRGIACSFCAYLSMALFFLLVIIR